MLGIFAVNQNVLIDRDQLLKEVWESEGIFTGRSLECVMRRKRRISSNHPKSPTRKFCKPQDFRCVFCLYIFQILLSLTLEFTYPESLEKRIVDFGKSMPIAKAHARPAASALTKTSTLNAGWRVRISVDLKVEITIPAITELMAIH